MTIRSLALLAFLSALPSCTLAQQPATPPDPYRDEPFVFERFDTTTTMKADGTGDILQHFVVRVQSEGVARQFSVLSLSYASAYSTGTMDYVRVHKADGTTVNTPTDEAMEMPAEVTREAPMYSDLKEKHLPVRALASGDRLEYQFHTILTKAQAPGEFWGADHFLVQGGVVLEQSVTLSVPENTYIQVWSPNHKVTPATHDGMKTWTWTSSQTKASARDENGKMTAAEVKDPDEDSDGRKLPSVAWTTFHSWAEVGDWYRSLAGQRLQPTATVRTKAEELTKNAKTPEEQAQALYRFVATQIRYISLSFGVGRFQPHTPEEVLDHGYGDCKDKDTLLESLLRAKGLTTAPVLIGAGIAPIADLPSPAVFNHAITTVQLPGADGKPQQVWLDSTAEVAPFRVLMPVLRDQQALVIPDKAPAALEKTPANPPYPYKERFEAVGTLSDKGTLKSHIQMTVRSDSELVYRAVLRQAAPAQWDELMQNVAGAMNFGGKVSNTDLRQTDPTAPVHISFDYTREDYGDWKNNRIWATMPALEITYIGKEKAPEHDIDLGAPRTLEVESIITVPTGDRAELPSARHVSRSYTTYDETYRFSEGKFIANRVVVVKQHKLSKAQWKDYLAFVKEAGLEDNMQEATLIAPATPSTSAHAASHNDENAPEDSETATAKQLQDASLASEKRNDWSAARRYAERAVARFPDEPYSHGVLAYVDAHDRRYDEAIANYKAELASHPDDNTSIVRLLAGVYNRQKRYAETVALLKQYDDRQDIQLYDALSATQILMGDNQAALGTVRKIVAIAPDNRLAQSQLANVLYSLHRYDDASVAVRKAVDGSDDPNIINNNIYLLSEMKIDLPFAETQSRRSVDLLEKATASHNIDEANATAFAESSNLTASWDTLGYILLLQGKPKEAEPYLRAAWFSQQNVVVGNHLAQALEASDRKPEALWMYVLSQSAEHATDSKEDYSQMSAAIERLVKEGTRSSTGEAFATTMQDFRTYHVKNNAGAEGGGTVRVQLSPDGVATAMLVSGDAKLKPLLDEAKSLRLPGAEPSGSPARVLRDAVVYCAKKSTRCDFVFMVNSGIAVEGASE